jgi:hypothetical protein
MYFTRRMVFWKTEGTEGAGAGKEGAGAGAGTGKEGAGAEAGAGAAKPEGEAGKGAEAAKPGEAAKAGEPGKAAEGERKTLLGKEQVQGAKPKLDITALKAPEGFTLDKSLMDEFVPLAEQHGLSLEAAQGVVNLGAKMANVIEKRGRDAWDQQVSKWESESKADPEIGGAKLKENLTYAAKGAMLLGGSDLVKILDDTGFGSNPVFIKALAKAGRGISEDSVGGGGGSTGGELSQEEKDSQRYPKMEATLKSRGQR